MGYEGEHKTQVKEKPKKQKQKPQSESVVPSELKTINLMEIGPGTGKLMMDTLKTIH